MILSCWLGLALTSGRRSGPGLVCQLCDALEANVWVS